MDGGLTGKRAARWGDQGTTRACLQSALLLGCGRAPTFLSYLWVAVAGVRGVACDQVGEMNSLNRELS